MARRMRCRGWPFDSPELLRVHFIFVPHGKPEPREWLATEIIYPPIHET